MIHKKTLLCILCLLPCALAIAAVQLQNRVTGISGAAKANVLTQLQFLQQSTDDTITRNTIEHWHNLAPAAIQKALQPFGFYRAKIHSTLDKKKDHWLAHYAIQPGPSLRVNHVNISITGSGKEESAFKQLIQSFPLKTGDILLTQHYQRGKQAFFNTAEQLGYLDATMQQHHVDINLKKYTADIRLHFVTGKRYQFGKIKFSKVGFSDDFLNRFVNFKQGQAYSVDKLLVLQDNLSSSNYFQHVLVHGDKQQSQQIPINVSLKPRKPQVYSVGAGYGSDTGPRASLGWNWRWTNPYGHHMRALINLAQTQRSAMMRYVIPGKNPVTDQFNITGGIKEIDINKGNSVTQQLGIHYITPLGSWQQTLSLNYQREDSQLVGEDKRLSRYLLPAANWQVRKSNHPFFANKGYTINVSSRAAFRSMLSTTDFVQLELQGKYIHPISHMNHLVLRTHLGYTTGNNLSVLPISLRYFTGGAKSIRGYGYQSIGPGRYLAVASAEFQQRVINSWYLSTFYDVGDAFTSFPLHKNSGAGLGITWVSPIGPIAVTWAKNLEDPRHPSRIQFTMGPNL